MIVPVTIHDEHIRIFTLGVIVSKLIYKSIYFYLDRSGNVYNDLIVNFLEVYFVY